MKENTNRIRSKCYLLEYKTKIPHENLKRHLTHCFRIDKDTAWKYLIKTEEWSDGQCCTLVFVEFTERKDVYVSRLLISYYDKKITGKYKAVLDKDLALSYILKSVDSFGTSTTTNMSECELSKHIRVLKSSVSYSHDNPPKVETSLKSVLERPIETSETKTLENVAVKSHDLNTKPAVLPVTEKQLNTIKTLLLKINNALNSESLDETLLLRSVINLKNYYYKKDFVIDNKLKQDMKETLQLYKSSKKN